METATRNYNEKRNFIRMKVNSPVNVSSEGDSLNGTCINLSGGGMLIALDQTLEPGGLIEVAISSSHGHNPMLRALAQVNRVIPDNSKYIIGLEIKTLIDA